MGPILSPMCCDGEILMALCFVGQGVTEARSIAVRASVFSSQSHFVNLAPKKSRAKQSPKFSAQKYCAKPDATKHDALSENN